MKAAFLAALITAASAAAIAGASTQLAGCGIDGYCITCANGDGGGGSGDGGGGGGDGGVVGDGGSANDGAPPDACVPSGIEQCDNHDNDCDGMVDEGDLPGVGDPCGTDDGECTAGTRDCVAGELVCDGVNPTPEICDNLDNDCVLGIDNGDPEGGVLCGTNAGECVAGVTHCLDGGDLQCVGASGTVGGVAESCDGLDNDCDGVFDEDIPSLGTCGLTDTGACELGERLCQGGQAQCVGAVMPVLELCDAIDQDCDGNNVNGFALTSDASNCGSCGTFCAGDEVQVADCVGGECVVDTCVTDYWDNDDDIDNGCEYFCVFQGAAEACNGDDDDCDGQFDEDVVTPANLCDDDGACAGATSQCIAGAWQCNYGSNVPVDGSGDILPETTCDELDNDCDGDVDESHPLAGTDCNDGADGICRAFGSYECDPMAPLGAVICVIDDAGENATAEACNSLDDDCDGLVDEGALTGALQTWVDIGNGVEMFAYEASRPDSDSTSAGAQTGYACSKPGVPPWTNVKHEEAKDACLAIGANLCTESEWNRACSVISQPNPVVQPNDASGIVFIEAELYTNLVPRSSRTWMPDSTAGFSGFGAMRASPNSAVNNQFATGSFVANAPRLDYRVQFTKTGTHYVWVKMLGPNANDNRVHIGLDGAAVAASDNISPTPGPNWTWIGGNGVATMSIATTGIHTINLFVGEDGVKVDALFLTTTNGLAPTGSTLPGCKWSYDSACLVYAANTCNGEDFDTTPGGTDDDAVLLTGARTSCDANWGAAGKIYDMSGNVKEWAAERLTGVNGLRGGASNSQGDGLACSFNFTVADNNFFFPNVGFRCCR